MGLPFDWKENNLFCIRVYIIPFRDNFRDCSAFFFNIARTRDKYLVHICFERHGEQPISESLSGKFSLWKHCPLSIFAHVALKA